ncbi:hypothetical protein [Agromyces mediolanus]|uniref:hypothetical protein n=1 Tax=Agromyces mediolanus TaxID=41986 RepID=UPI001E4A88E6|nr:hypothetical protein [Agromyces mediolanus]MCD1569900.1 hypothetical protein [Agromyces mediolanus]
MSAGEPVGREELDDEAYQIREVYAQYGLASYCSQTVERGLINILTVAATASSPLPTQATYDTHLARLSRLTFGQLVGTYEQSGNADAVVLPALREAAPIRNFITHRFFWDRAVDFLSYAGREGMLAELSNARARFEELETLLGALVRVTAAEAGIDLDWFEQRLEEQIENLRASAPAD